MGAMVELAREEVAILQTLLFQSGMLGPESITRSVTDEHGESFSSTTWNGDKLGRDKDLLAIVCCRDSLSPAPKFRARNAHGRLRRGLAEHSANSRTLASTNSFHSRTTTIATSSIRAIIAKRPDVRRSGIYPQLRRIAFADAICLQHRPIPRSSSAMNGARKHRPAWLSATH